MIFSLFLVRVFYFLQELLGRKRRGRAKAIRGGERQEELESELGLGEEVVGKRTRAQCEPEGAMPHETD